MTHAIVIKETNTVAKDAQGYGHIYSSKEYAEKVMREQFSDRDDVMVKPW